MISIDTNILVRLVTADDKDQARKAKRLFKKEQVYITKTVVLESEWVLRYAYGFPERAIADAFMKLLGQENVLVEDAGHVTQSTNLLLKGMDFADALHLACSLGHTFVTFDKKLKTKADAAGLKTVRLL